MAAAVTPRNAQPQKRALGRGLSALIPQAAGPRSRRGPRLRRARVSARDRAHPPRPQPAAEDLRRGQARGARRLHQGPGSDPADARPQGRRRLPAHRRRAALARGAAGRPQGDPRDRPRGHRRPRPSSWPWSRTSSARTSTPSRRPRATGGWSRSSGSPRSRSASVWARTAPRVANALRLLALPDEVKEMLAAGALEHGPRAGAARA